MTPTLCHAGAHARLRGKAGLLGTLVERVRDSNAYTRARALQTWGHLAQASAIPLGHWVCVTQLAAGICPKPCSVLPAYSGPSLWPASLCVHI